MATKNKKGFFRKALFAIEWRIGYLYAVLQARYYKRVINKGKKESASHQPETKRKPPTIEKQLQQAKLNERVTGKTNNNFYN